MHEFKRFIQYLWLLSGLIILVSCSSAPAKRAHVPPPLKEAIAQIKVGQTLDEVKNILDGNEPDLYFTATDKNYSIWEFDERDGRQAFKKVTPPSGKKAKKERRPDGIDEMGFPIGKGMAIESKRTLIVFDQYGKVKDVSVNTCLVPDVEFKQGNSPKTTCYQKRQFSFNKQITYDAIKRFLIISNYQIGHSDMGSEIISADGIQPIGNDKEKTMFIKLSIMFSQKRSDLTEVVMSATFSISQKQKALVQAGMAGVTIPIPNPFQKKEQWIKSGIATPMFYQNFYDSLSSLMSNEFLVYEAPVVRAEPVVAAPPVVAEIAASAAVIDQTTNVVPDSVANVAPVTAETVVLKTEPLVEVAAPVAAEAAAEEPEETKADSIFTRSLMGGLKKVKDTFKK